MRKKVKNKNIVWYNIINPKPKDYEFLRVNFKWHPISYKDAQSNAQYPKIDIYEDYIFIVLLFPIYIRTTRCIKASEVDFIIGKDYFITIHDNKLIPLKNFFDLIQTTDTLRQNVFQNPARLLYECLNKLIFYCYPMLTHISEDISKIEEKIFSRKEREVVSDVLIVKRNIVNFKKIMQSHKNILKKLILYGGELAKVDELSHHYSDLIDQTKDIWDIIQSLSESIKVLHETNESLISYRINLIMKTLTVFSVIVFPLTLLAAIFGMNITGGMPFLDLKYGFWVIVGTMVVATIFMYKYFKYKKWI